MSQPVDVDRFVAPIPAVEAVTCGTCGIRFAASLALIHVWRQRRRRPVCPLCSSRARGRADA